MRSWENRIRNRVYEGIWGAVFIFTLTNVARHLDPEAGVPLLAQASALNVVLNLVGVASAWAIAGPVGVLGFVFEYWGANVFIEDPTRGLAIMGLGAGVIVFGRPLWSWVKEERKSW